MRANVLKVSVKTVGGCVVPEGDREGCGTSVKVLRIRKGCRIARSREYPSWSPLVRSPLRSVCLRKA